MGQASTSTKLSRTACSVSNRCEGCRSPHVYWEATAMITIREESFHDVEAREALLDSCFGPTRFQKTCERLREGRKAADGLSLVIEQNGEIVGTVRLWHVCAGPNRPALMLGPLAVDPKLQSLGLGGKLM